MLTKRSWDALRHPNGWDSYQTWEYFRLVKKRWEYNSEFLWALDFSNIQHPDGGLTIKASWQRDNNLTKYPSSSPANLAGSLQKYSIRCKKAGSETGIVYCIGMKGFIVRKPYCTKLSH